jgi:phosphoribosylformimino-5-aminoimidazole carboxamide ribotide isomerase
LTALDLYPAIDLRGGRVVRLAQGDFARETVYGDDPVAVARAYESAGAPWVHVVDLDAAKGQGSNRDLVAAVAGAVSIPVQAGGGIRTLDDADALVAAGVARLVVGTAAFRRPGFVAELSAAHPGRVAVDVAVAGQHVAVQGWTEATGERVEDAVSRFVDAGLAAFVVTDVRRDGMLAGPDVAGLTGAVATARGVPVIASGGVGALADFAALGPTGVAGVIVGRALYEGRFTVEQAVEACR